jgi:hypothetical protein
MTNQERIYTAALEAAQTGWKLTRHAERQSATKGIDPFTLMAAAGSPTVRYAHGPKHPGQWRHIRDGIVAVVEPKTMTVITAYIDVERTALRADQRA